MSHSWVEVMYTPVTVEREGDELVVKASLSELESAEGDKSYLCWNCHAQLNEHTFPTLCAEGPTPDQLIEQ